MAEQKDNFEFEIEGEEREVTPVQKADVAPQQEKVETKGKPDIDIEIQDDTPAEDRGRQPMPKHMVDELEQDELEEYSERARLRLQQMKKVYHDERRAKDAAMREQQEALTLAQRLFEENKWLKSRLTEGEKSFIDTAKSAVEMEMEIAKRAYKEAYESGDSDKIVEAQSKLGEANYRLQQIKSYRPPLQEAETPVNNVPDQRNLVEKPDPKAVSWQERNPWFGPNRVMTAMALGLHEELTTTHGLAYATTDEYYQRIDKTMREKFPEEFGTETTNGGGKPVARTEKPATVVAPASRSTSSKKVVLKQSELALAKRFNLTPEQYAKEKMRLESQNG
jgi:hypothetical protein